MKKNLLTIIISLLSINMLSSQSIITDFESFNLEIDTFLNGSDGSGGFTGNNIFLPNDFNSNYGSWTGWSISTVVDTVTPGFTNQYASISGNGANGSTHYATTFVSGTSTVDIEGGYDLESISVNNDTYPFLSMLNGDSFAKKFGGETGDDPDFFSITIKASLNGEIKEDSIEFFLADYRFEDNSMDYIINEWTEIDLTSLGTADQLIFSLNSSDIGAFGINTPGYFCMDNITLIDFADSQENIEDIAVNVYPNPATDWLIIEMETQEQGNLSVYDNSGRMVFRHTDYTPNTAVSISTLDPGQYVISLMMKDKKSIARTLLINK